MEDVYTFVEDTVMQILRSKAVKW